MWILILLSVVSVVGSEAVAQDAEMVRLGKGAYEIFQKQCGDCHGKGEKIKGALNLFEKDVFRRKGLIDTAAPEKSELIVRVLPGGGMPPRGQGTALTDTQVALLKSWIAKGTPDESGRVATVSVAGSKGKLEHHDDKAEDEPLFELKVLNVVYQDLRRLDRLALLDARYLSLAHLLLLDMPEANMEVYRNGLRKLLNSLTWKKAPVKIVPIDKQKTIFRVSLKDLGWTSSKWNSIADKDPFKIDHPQAIAGIVSRAVPHSTRIVVRGDWFAAATSASPTYYDILDIPKTAAELEKLLNVNALENISKSKVARAAMRVSKVSKSYRMIERHDAKYGAFWRSYDFDGNSGKKDLFKLPLTNKDTGTGKFEHAGGEVIFHLPNGLQGYWLEKQDGTRLDVAPTEIVSDTSRRDPRIINGISCMGCHEPGLHIKFDDLLGQVERDPASFGGDVEQIKATYKKKDDMALIFKNDNERYTNALKAAGIVEEEGRESVRALVDRFEANVTVQSAAAELGISVEKLKDLADRDKRVDNLVYQLEGSGLPRDRFLESFRELSDRVLLAQNGRIPYPGRSHSFTARRSAVEGYKQKILVIDGATVASVAGFKGGAKFTATPAVLSDGETVVAASADQNVYWLNNGKRKFSLPTPNPITASPLVLGDGETVFVLSKGVALWAKAVTKAPEKPMEKSDEKKEEKKEEKAGDKKDETILTPLFNVEISKQPCLSPTVLGDGKTVVFGCDDKKLYWAREGEKIHEIEMPTSYLYPGGVLSDGETVVTSGRDEVYWVKDGKRLHTFEMGKGTYSSPVAILGDGATVFVASSDGSAYWLRNGKAIAEYDHGSETYAAPAVLGDGETVALGFNNGAVLWLKAGRVVFEGALETKGETLSPLVLGDGQTIVTGEGKTLYWMRQGKTVVKFFLSEPPGSPAVLLKDGKTIVLGSTDKAVFWLRFPDRG